MKKYIFLLLIIISVSCKSYRDFLSVETLHVINAQDSIIDGLYVNGEIDGVKAKLIFDTGATRSVLNDINLIGGKSILNADNHKTLNKVKGVEGIEFSLLQYKTKSFSINTFKSKNKYLFVFNQQQIHNCNSKLNVKNGILGLDAFYNSETPVLLDYENNTIKILDSIPEMSNYANIDTIIKNNRIVLISEINNKKIELLFDTGNSGYVLLSESHFNTEADEIIESISLTANNTLRFPTQELYFNKSIDIGGINDSHNYITVIDDFKSNGVGLQFINQYNWIIDFKNKKLYAKKIKDYPGSNLKKLINHVKYISIEFNNELIIAHKQDPSNRFQIGAIIISVNNIKVTKENICEIQDMLNKEKDWSIFKIETSPRME